jgi:hypothetical protein
MKRLLYILLFFLVCYPAGGELVELGINPLRLEMGARPLGMGAAFVGLADDVNAVIYNPAGLAWVKGVALTVRDFENLTALQAYPTGNNSSLGLAVVNSRVSDVPFSGGLASSNSNVVLLSYGTKLSLLPMLYKQDLFQRIGVGLSLKGLLGETLRRTGQRDLSATGWDMDLGVLWKGADWWSAGFSAQNFLPAKALGGGEIKWNLATAEGIPASAKLAASARIIGDLGTPVFMEGKELTLGGELDLSGSSPALLRLGGEWGFNRTYFIRAGIMQQWKTEAVVTSLNYGLGFRSEEWGAEMAGYREPLRDEFMVYFSVLYFPRDWVVVRKLDVEKPGVVLETALEKISLEDNIVTYDDKIEVVGKVKPGVEVYVNELHAATSDDNTFRVVVPLQMEKNLIVVEARYEGEKKSWKYKVLRKARVSVAGGKREELAARRQRVEELVTLGVIEVSPEAEFKLDASITRGELATWLAKASGLRLPRVEKDLFSDVKRDHPLAPYIKAVVDWNLLQPFPDGTFRPEAPVSKEEGEKLFRLLKKAQR